ncbi:DEAD/DEAH box helicase [Telmatospirillum siberiense]|nr:DEAD/DEAH box helicase [Telmatospirillum siberiense]
MTKSRLDVATLSPAEQTILKLKALLGPAIGKTRFLDCLNRLRTTVPAWQGKTLAPVLDSLRIRGFLADDFACAPELLQPLAAAAIASPEGPAMIEAIGGIVPQGHAERYWDYRSVEADTARWLRIAVLLNDEALFGRQMELRNRYCRSARPPMDLFADTVVGTEWLASRSPFFQREILRSKTDHLIRHGTASPDYGALMDHGRQTLLPQCFSMLAEFYAISGRLADLADLIAAASTAEEATTFAAVHALLSGDPGRAAIRFGEALRLHRKAARKRKIWLPGRAGLLHLCALLATDDAAHHADIEAALGEMGETPGQFALQALFDLARNRATAAEWARRAMMAGAAIDRIPPFEAALPMIAAALVDPPLAREQIERAVALFRRVEDSLPLVAGMVAEVLERIVSGEPYRAFLARPGREISFRFLEIIAAKAAWERSLESLEAMLVPAAPASAEPPTRRLVWRIDADGQAVEPVEQMLQARGWSAGRPVSLKRLHQDAAKFEHADEFDRRAMRAIRRAAGRWYGHEFYELAPETAFPALVGHPRLFDMDNPAQPVELVEGRAEVVLTSTGSGFRLALSHAAFAPGIFIERETPGRWRVVVIDAKAVDAAAIIGEGIVVPAAARDRLTALARAQAPSLPLRVETPEIEDAAAQPGDPTPVVRLAPLGEGLKVSLVVRPLGTEGAHFLPGLGGRTVLVGTTRVRRDLAEETRLARALAEACPSLSGEGPEWHLEELMSGLEFLSELRRLPVPAAMEWPEGQSLSLRGEATAKSFKASIRGGDDWFSLGGSVSIDEDLVLDLKDLLSRLDQARGRFLPLDDGGFLVLESQFRRQLERLRRMGDDLKIAAVAGVAVRDILEDAGSLKADARWRDFTRRLDDAGDWRPALPAGLEAELRDYQVEGFLWMSRLSRWGAGALLADDMGLGKTVQAIAVMLDKAAEGPCLVVAPTSVCGNWVAELSRFAPGLKARRLAEADDRAETLGALGTGDVLICSYGLLTREEDRLSEAAWAMTVFDEAQAIKNADTRRARSSQRLRAGFRLALTGTPVENDLEELWSLFRFINPTLLGSRKSFAQRFGTPIGRDNEPIAKATLKALVRPFLLRRTKAAVLAELPARTEQTLWIDLDAEERALYEALRRRALENLEAAGQRTRIHILAEITKLRQACCHPALASPGTEIAGAKLSAFLDLVKELRQGRHRALVFSQFVGHLGKIRAALDAEGISYQYLDGATAAREREQRVAAFQAGAGQLFLISLKAGGFGLNLTAADYVIHLDPWWNPAVEDQASDRAHRIGQQRPVTIYRLIVKDSIEEGILGLHRKKRDLADALLEGSDVSARLSEEDLLGLIRGGEPGGEDPLR